MNAENIIKRARLHTAIGEVSDDVLFGAIEEVERDIEKYAEREHREFITKEDLLACGGGVAIGYEKMYDSVVKREACRLCEQWDNYGNYDAIFAIEWEKLKAEIVRGRKKNSGGFY